MESFHAHREFRRPITAAFTLLEMLVSLGIITVITAVAITSQSSFNKSIVLTNAAYDVALSIRSAQAFGVGSRSPTFGVVKAGYGIHFDKSATGSYLLFGDTYPAASCTLPSCKSGDGLYTASSDASQKTYTFGNGVAISDICVSNGTVVCAFSSGSSVNTLDIVFARPSNDPTILINGVSAGTYFKAYIALTSPQGGVRYVCVTSAGLIVPTPTITPSTVFSCP